MGAGSLSGGKLRSRNIVQVGILTITEPRGFSGREV